jgi:PST family polysaccharide transporter
LDGQFAKGLAWTAGAKWTTQAITWLSAIVAARLLSPSDYGLVDMGTMLFGLTAVLAEFGIGTAVLQTPLSRAVLAQLNTASVLFSGVWCLLSFAAAGLVATFFARDELQAIVRIIGIAFLISGLQAVPQGLLQRDMDFRRLSLLEAAQVLLQAAVTVAGAAVGWGYWALIAGPIAGRALSVVLTAWWHPVGFAIPRRHDLAEPLRFGCRVALGQFAGRLYGRADSIVLGRMLGEKALGEYRLGATLANTPMEKIGALLMRVTGPLFANVQDDLAAMRRYHLIFAEVLALTVWPLAIGLAATAPEFMVVVLGTRWIDGAGPLRWLALYMMVQPLAALAAQVLVSLRITGFALGVQLVSLAILPGAFWWASRWGPTGVAAAWLLLAPVTALPLVVAAVRATDCRTRSYIAALMPAATACTGMCAIVLTADLLLDGVSPLWRLGLKSATGGVAYCLILATVWRPRVIRYFRFLTSLRRQPSPAAGGSGALTTSVPPTHF